MSFLTFRVIFISLLLSLGAGPICFWLARRLKLLDVPGSEPHKLHQSQVPLAGGFVLFISVLIASLINQGLGNRPLWEILIPALLVFSFGLIDDSRRLPALWKLVGQLLGAVLLIYLGVQVRMFRSDWANWALTILWVVGITNAYNFVDSKDGLAIGLAAMAAVFFMLVTYDAYQLDLSQLSAALLGACLGLFYFNAAPAYFFLGDSGAQFLGTLIAGLAIAYNPKGFMPAQSWYIPILLVGVPIFDMVLVVYSRLRQGRPVYQAGLDHTYHRLVSLGLDPGRAVLTMHVNALLLGCLAFIALSLPPIFGNAVFSVCVLVGVILVVFLERKRRLS